MRLFTMFAVAAMFICGAVVGAEPGPNYEHLKPMEWMIGTWVLKEQVPDDSTAESPLKLQKGDLIEITAMYDWGLNKNVMRVQHTILINGNQIMDTDGMFGWAVDKKQIAGFDFDSLGGHGESVYSVLDESAFKIVGSHLIAGSENTLVTTIVKKVDKNTITSQRINITVGGVEQPDEEVLTWKRKK